MRVVLKTRKWKIKIKPVLRVETPRRKTTVDPHHLRKEHRTTVKVALQTRKEAIMSCLTQMKDKNANLLPLVV